MSCYRRAKNGNWVISVERGQDPETGKRIRKQRTLPGYLKQIEAEKEMAKMLYTKEA